MKLTLLTSVILGATSAFGHAVATPTPPPEPPHRNGTCGGLYKDFNSTIPWQPLEDDHKCVNLAPSNDDGRDGVDFFIVAPGCACALHVLVDCEYWWRVALGTDMDGKGSLGGMRSISCNAVSIPPN